jgi:4-hydroxy-tetrahydrodipicolinate reductase
MGHEIESVALARKHRVSRTFDIDTPFDQAASHRDLDVVIDFSVPEAVVDNIAAAARSRIPIVVGTTGWNTRIDEVKRMIAASNTAVIYAANFSLGMHLFFRIVRSAAELMDGFADYDAFIHEIHHRGKIDSPSGTALHLGEILLAAIGRKDSIEIGRSDGIIAEAALHITSTRAGVVPGTHLVGFDSPADSIELKHIARNRTGFALGAVSAAEWLVGKTGFYSVADLIDDLISRGKQ